MLSGVRVWKPWKYTGLCAMCADVQRRVCRVDVDTLVGGNGEGEGERGVWSGWIEVVEDVGRDLR